MLNAEGEDVELKKRVEKEGRLGWDKKRVLLRKKPDQIKGASTAGVRVERPLMEKEQSS